MLFRMSRQNVRRSVRDYAIYFFTLIIGISVFYVFNSIGGQAAMLRVSDSSNEIVELLETLISGVSVFVAIVLALLIVYASRFIMKRRNKEFALYMMLGMGKRKISAILLIESLIVGAGSLVFGLLLGIAASQLMSALVVGLFKADMSEYRLSVSGEAMVLTIVCFVVMYFSVMLFNGASVTRMKLIDLMQSGKKSEQVKLRNPFVCVAIFVVSCILLSLAYYQVAFSYETLSRNRFILSILVGSVTTFLIFWSVSGLMLRIVMSFKKIYHKGLNAFTYRQISSKINTMVMSMTVICLMLFVTICALAASFSVRNVLNKNLTMYCPVDAQIMFFNPELGPDNGEIESLYTECGEDITENIKEYSKIHFYGDKTCTMDTTLGDARDRIKAEYPYMDTSLMEYVVKVSEYNKIRELYGQKPLELKDDEYIITCDFSEIKSIRDYALKSSASINVFGHSLKPGCDKTMDGFVLIGSQPMNIGIIVVPDHVVDEASVNMVIYSMNYDATSREEKSLAEDSFRNSYKKVIEYAKTKKTDNCISVNTAIDIDGAATGIGAILTFLGLYIGIVFLIASGAILALKELSESVDSIPRYEMLRKIGASEKEINRSLLRQTGIFFMIPLLLAAIHSFFGMKFAINVLKIFGTVGIGGSIAATLVILALIYGGYFTVTYINAKSIINV
ncbi:MAG: FtsX-like permease family protein [Lachnospiraceae bacterium]|nr:FtsX-like permease family protein [Lachnospiraceae bacterium]